MSEEWRPIPGYELTYRVSSDGRVESLPRNTTRGGMLKQRVNKRGYPALALVQCGKQRTHEVHRLVALAFLGPRPDGQEVRHVNGNSLDSRAGNLAYGTRSENQLDLVAHGRHVTARKTHCTKGHAYDDLNTRTYRGRRYCRTCDGWTGHPDYREEWRP